MNSYLIFLAGILVGWVIKIPFLIKWYRELKRTRTYEKAKNAVEYKAMVDRYNKLHPDRAL